MLQRLVDKSLYGYIVFLELPLRPTAELEWHVMLAIFYCNLRSKRQLQHCARDNDDQVLIRSMKALEDGQLIESINFATCTREIRDESNGHSQSNKGIRGRGNAQREVAD